MKLLFGKISVLLAAIMTLGFSAQATTVSITYVDAPTGVNDGTYYVLPYQLNIDGMAVDATCYDVFDIVGAGQSWTANELTLSEAALTGQFGGQADSLAGYEEVGFLFRQTTNSAQDQIDLQHDIWNVFAPGRYAVTTGMQNYLDLITPAAYQAYDFNTALFLEDVNQGSGRAQAFVIDPADTAPEPATTVPLGGGALLIGIGRLRRIVRRKLNQPFVSRIRKRYMTTLRAD